MPEPLDYLNEDKREKIGPLNLENVTKALKQSSSIRIKKLVAAFNRDKKSGISHKDLTNSVHASEIVSSVVEHTRLVSFLIFKNGILRDDKIRT